MELELGWLGFNGASAERKQGEERRGGGGGAARSPVVVEVRS